LNPERYDDYDVNFFKDEQNSGCIVGMGCQKEKLIDLTVFTVMKEGLSVKDIFCHGKFVIRFSSRAGGACFQEFRGHRKLLSVIDLVAGIHEAYLPTTPVRCRKNLLFCQFSRFVLVFQGVAYYRLLSIFQ
jgi:hypothetical protein